MLDVRVHWPQTFILTPLNYRSMIQLPSIQKRVSADKTIDSALAKYEKDFHTHFSHFCFFPEILLKELHQSSILQAERGRVRIASKRVPELARYFKLFKGVANLVEPNQELRESYFADLCDVYRSLDQTPERHLENSGAVFVAPARAGQFLAMAMQWTPEGRWFHPEMKRILHKKGMLVGMSRIRVGAHLDVERMELIDGAIASGATLMTLMEFFAARCRIFDIYCVHAAEEGIAALSEYAKRKKLEVTIFAGHCTSGLNEKYYAIDSSRKRQIVGDLGDTISGLPEVIALGQRKGESMEEEEDEV